MNFLSELTEMRSKYKSPWRCTLKKPDWLRRTDRLNSIFDDSKTLFKNGKIYYAVMVQANEILFNYFPHRDAPANFVYSTDPYFEESPDELCYVATSLYKYKYQPPEKIPEEYRAIAAAITDEHDRTRFEFEVTLDGIPRKIFFVTTIVFRRHLPKDRLLSPILPVLTDLENSENIIILPRRYWTKPFKKMYTA